MPAARTIAQKQERDDARAKLRELLPPGTTVYTVLRHVSRSGMMRHLDLYKIDNGEPFYLTGYVALALEDNRTDAGYLKVGGCGMDVGFHVVHSLGYVLYPDGYECPGEPDSGQHWSRSGCPSSAHVNPGSDRDKYGPGIFHKDGYALRHRWL